MPITIAAMTIWIASHSVWATTTTTTATESVLLAEVVGVRVGDKYDHRAVQLPTSPQLLMSGREGEDGVVLIRSCG